MIKIFTTILAIYILYNVQGGEPQYKIEKIKSVNGYYVIYASRNDSIFKIVSKKANHQVCSEKIKKNRCYMLKFEEVNSLAGPEVECFSFDERTEICRELGIGLYVSTNLAGLCINNQ